MKRTLFENVRPALGDVVQTLASVNALQEPATLPLLLMGLGLVTLMIRQRRG